MAAIDWVYVGSLGGEYIENFVATCLRQRYHDALQTKPAQGDGGIDISRPTADGLVVWQVKKFTAPLTSSQKTQVKKSWKRFWKSRVVLGTKIAKYHLATPWTPTDDARDWFAKVTEDAPFPVQWDGESFFNGLASDFPATADRFFKGADMLEAMVNSKAMLASLPVDQTDGVTMVSAIAQSEENLREIRDLVNDNYYIDSGTRSYRAGTMPTPDPSEIGVYHRYTALGNNRFYVESVVPRNAQSTELEPLTLEVEFQVEPDSDDEKQLKNWIFWGAPFRDLPGRTRQKGGPLADVDLEIGLLSFMQIPTETAYPRLDLRTMDDDGVEQDIMELQVRDVTTGVTGDGLRVVAHSPQRAFELEMRCASQQAADDFDLRILDTKGLTPASVQSDLDALSMVAARPHFIIYFSNGSEFVRGSGLRPGKYIELLLQLSTDLAELQENCTTTIILPSLSDLTLSQAERVHDLAQLYRGNPKISSWQRMPVKVEDPDKWREALSRSQTVVHLNLSPILHLGQDEYRFNRAIAETAHSVALAPEFQLELLAAGDEIEIVPGADDRTTTAVVVDGQLPQTSS